MLACASLSAFCEALRSIDAMPRFQQWCVHSPALSHEPQPAALSASPRTEPVAPTLPGHSLLPSSHARFEYNQL